ncbi:MAG: 3D domain-containing protein [Clostridia bacterium]|nr:3D domain-containing protein [Clostridia bacterium]
MRKHTRHKFVLSVILIALMLLFHQVEALTRDNARILSRLASYEKVNLMQNEALKKIKVKVNPAIPSTEPCLPVMSIQNGDTQAMAPRGERKIRSVTMRVKAYDLSYASCKKLPSHPEYGITASGSRVKEWYTVAAGPGIPFGTRIYIPYFKDKPNGGVFVVQDRGNAVKDNCLDVFMQSHKACMQFGVRNLEIYILDGGVTP